MNFSLWSVQCAVCSVESHCSVTVTLPVMTVMPSAGKILINVDKKYIGVKEVNFHSVSTDKKTSAPRGGLLLGYAKGFCFLTMPFFFSLSNRKLLFLDVFQFLAIRYTPGTFGGKNPIIKTFQKFEGIRKKKKCPDHIADC